MTPAKDTQSRTALPCIGWLCIIAVLWLAMALRCVALDQVPPALHSEEAVNGYEAYSLLKTGRDQWGNPWPVTIRGFNDYRRPGFIYSLIPFVATLGLSAFGVRAAAAVWGLLGVLFTYRLARDMFGWPAGTLAGLMLAISPWHLPFSRLGVEATLTILTVVLGVLCAWRWFISKRRAWLIGAGLAFGLSLYTQPTAQAFTPLMAAAFVLVSARRVWQYKRVAMLAALVLVLTTIPLVYSLASNPQTWNRLDAVGVLRPDEPLYKSLTIVGRQWLGHFSPDYLFVHGDAQKYYHPPGFGQLYAVDALLLPLGVLGMFWARKNRSAGALLMAWIALGALPAALTIQEMGTPHSMRGIFGLPAYAIVSAQGIMTIWNARHLGTRWRMALLGTLAGLLIWNAATFLQNYFVVYPVRAARAFEYGVKEAVEYITAHEDEYDAIVVTNWISQPHIFVLFFQRYDPRRFQAEPIEYSPKLAARLKHWDKYWVGDVEKFYAELEHGLFVAPPHMLEDVEPDLVIYYPNGLPAFKIISK